MIQFHYENTCITNQTLHWNQTASDARTDTEGEFNSLDYILVETLYAYSLLNHINYNKFIYTLFSTSSPFFDVKEKVITRNL